MFLLIWQRVKQGRVFTRNFELIIVVL